MGFVQRSRQTLKDTFFSLVANLSNRQEASSLDRRGFSLLLMHVLCEFNVSSRWKIIEKSKSWDGSCDKNVVKYRNVRQIRTQRDSFCSFPLACFSISREIHIPVKNIFPLIILQIDRSNFVAYSAFIINS